MGNITDVPEIRASDSDRERSAALLRRHFAEGRLTADELSDRLDEVFASRTLSDLRVPFRELPVLAAPPPEQVTRTASLTPARHHGKGFREHFSIYVIINAFLIIIWLLTTPGGYFWPIWPILGWGVGVAAHWAATRPSSA